MIIAFSGTWVYEQMKAITVICIILEIMLCVPMTYGIAVERVINVAVNPNLPPYQYQDNGRVAGIHIDILDKIALDKGYQIKYIQKKNDNECLAALKKGEADAIIGMNRNKAVDAGLALTDIMTSSSLCMVVWTDAMKAKGKGAAPFPLSAAIEFGTTPYTMITNLGITRYQVFGNQEEVFDALRNNTVDAAIAVKDSILFQIDQIHKGKAFTIIHNYLGYVSYGLAVRPEDQEFLHILNDGISKIRVGKDYETILSKWIVVVDEMKSRQTLRLMGLVSAIALILVAAYILISLRVRSAMKHHVDMQTMEIQEANKKLERQIHQINDENELRNRIIKYSPSAMVLMDRKNIVTLMNRSAQVLTGIHRMSGELSIDDLPVFREVVGRIGPRIFETGAAIGNERLKHGDRSLRCTIHQIILYGEVNGVLIMIQDVTKEEQQTLAEFEKEKNLTLNRLVAGIAHEIRNPLMSIRTFATVIGSQGDNQEVQQSFSKYVPNEVDRINRLIENMIQYAKPVKRQVRRTSVDEMIQECVSLISPSISSNRIDLSVEICDDPIIFVDRDQIKQVLINLLMNSIEAIEKKLGQSDEAGGLKLRIRAMTRQESVVIEVYDEGTGMTKQELDNCLEPFFTTKSSGTGLGLALCKQYLNENTGQISIQSAEGSYTKITLAFPRSIRETQDTDHR